MFAKSAAARWMFGLMAVLLLAGCAAGAYGDERNWPLGMGELPSMVGNVNRPAGDNTPVLGVGTGSFPDLWADGRLPEKTGFAAPTGKWFFENGEGKLGYGLTGGVQRPGNELAVTLFGHEEGGVAVDRDVRIRLIARTQDLAAQETLLDEIVHVGRVSGELRIFEGVVPDGENKFYTLSAEMLDAEGKAEDTRVSLIYVPRPEINALLATDRAVYGKKDGEARLALANGGPTVLMLGMAYTVEKRVGDKWRVVPLDIAFPEIAVYLLPGETHEQSFDPMRLPEGSYRIIKEIRADGFEDLKATLAAEFQVQR